MYSIEEYPIALRYLIRLLLAFAIIAALIITKQLLVPLCLSFCLFTLSCCRVDGKLEITTDCN